MHNGFLLELIRTPVITEKSNSLSAMGKVLFKVSPLATKLTVKQAVEEIFKVKVDAVNILNRKGKPKLHKGKPVKRINRKFAVVTLAKGENIELGIGA